MKKILKRILNLIFAAVPVLCLTSAMADAFVCALATFLSFSLALIVKKIDVNIVPPRVKNIVVLIFITLGISLVDIFFCGWLPVSESVQFLPLCAVSAVLLLGMTDENRPKKRLAVSAFVTGGLFAALLLLLSAVRELLGQGTLFSLPVTKSFLKPAAIFSLPAGAIFIIAVVIAAIKTAAKEEKENA